MKERPILFKGEMVRAILEGRKTQTRRVVKCDQKIARLGEVEEWARRLAGNACYGRAITETDIKEKAKQLQGRIHPVITKSGTMVGLQCPYGQPGDLIFVRESFSGPHCMEKMDELPAMPPRPWSIETPIWYWADGEPTHGGWTKSKPSIHMPRWASRITLKITGVRVERLQDISEADAEAEGWQRQPHRSNDPQVHADAARDWFSDLWVSINGDRSWDANPFVWVVEFERVPS